MEHTTSLQVQFRDEALFEEATSTLRTARAFWRPGDRINAETTRERTTHGCEIPLTGGPEVRRGSDVIVSLPWFRSAERDLMALAHLRGLIEATLLVRLQYAERTARVGFTREALAACSALGASIDIDAYRIHKSRSAEDHDGDDYTPTRYSVGTRGASVHAGAKPQVSYVSGATAARRTDMTGGTVGSHLAALCDDLEPWLGAFSLLATLHRLTFWCRASGGWGRPDAVISPTEVARVSRFRAEFELQISYD